MSSKFRQSVNSSQTHFTAAPMGEIEFSRMHSRPQTITDFNAGDIIPVYCAEVLPHDTFDISLQFDIRQSTIAVPTMGRMMVDYYAFFVPNRIINQSWKNVQGENSSGSWIAPDVSLAPLVSGNEGTIVRPEGSGRDCIQVPIGSVADYYGFPTQLPLPVAVLQQCNDLKFRGYLEIYNNYFRDQNYQPPIPYSKLNIYNGFFDEVGELIKAGGEGASSNRHVVEHFDLADGSYPDGAIVKALTGDGGSLDDETSIAGRLSLFTALGGPLKANKLHDYFTSVLPSPQKGRQVMFNFIEPIPLTTGDNYTFASGGKLALTPTSSIGNVGFEFSKLGFQTEAGNLQVVANTSTEQADLLNTTTVSGSNLYADTSTLGITLDDLRMSAAVQQLYEILGRSGSRYVEFVNSFFGLEVDNPFDDIPTMLGHIRRDLDLYQTAQTSASSADGSSSPQGNLAAFGYTSNGGHLFNKTFVEHGYVHIFAVVRHRNVYSSLLSRDNFRMNMLDFYTYPLANISEQPVYTREINPYVQDSSAIFGYGEAWAEYRMEPDRVTAHMRTGLGEAGLDFWNYADDFDSALEVADGAFMESNSASVLARSTALSETNAPQFKAQIFFDITKQRPMPTYSVAGLDII